MMEVRSLLHGMKVASIGLELHACIKLAVAFFVAMRYKNKKLIHDLHNKM